MEVKRPVILQRQELHQHHFENKSGFVLNDGRKIEWYDPITNKSHSLKPGDIFKFESRRTSGGLNVYFGMGRVLRNGKLSITHIGCAADHPHIEVNNIVLKKLKKPIEKGVDASAHNYNLSNKVPNREHGFKEYTTTFEELEEDWRKLNGAFWLQVVTPKPQYLKRPLWKKLLGKK